MRLVVIDASIAVKWVLTEPGDDAALKLLEDFGAGNVDLIAPPLLLAEVASALSKRCRRKELTGTQAQAAYERFEERRPNLISPEMRAALALSLQHRLSLWDSVYLALAIREDAELATADRRFHRVARIHHPASLLIV